MQKLTEEEKKMRKKEYDKKYRLKNKKKIEEYQKKHYQENKDSLLKKKKAWRDKNPEYDKEYYQRNKVKRSEQNKKWRLKNQTRINKNTRKRLKTDVNFKLSTTIRKRLRSAVDGDQKTGLAIDSLGCSIEYFKKYIADQFNEGMSWDNHSFSGWHLDHQIPLSVVNLEDRDDLLHVCHYTNIQPMWATDNFIKGNKINYGK